MISVLGIDPGFANIGWSILDVDPNPFAVIRVGLIVTAPSPRKLRVLQSSDDHRRAKEIAVALRTLIVEHNVKLICAEGFSAPPSKRTANRLASCWGILGSLCTEFELPMSQVSPQMLKRKLCGRMKVSDEELHDEVQRRYPELELLTECVAKTKREHLFDAVGATDACRDGEVFMTLRSSSADFARA